MTQVAFVKTQDRQAGVDKALDLLEIASITMKGKDLFLKPNFNSADVPPGSTHDDTLSGLVRWLQAVGAARITVGDRSGMGDTRGVMEQKGIYMHELHSSPHQRRMIAEINAAYQPDLILLDGVEAFVDGGPDRGKQVEAQVILAGTDRVAVDAVGVAVLRYFGTTPAVSQRSIFQQEQIARAVELGLGVESPEQIELVTDDPDSEAYAAEIHKILVRR